MLDINLIREKPEEVRANLALRKVPAYLEQLDEVLKIDGEWRKLKSKVDDLRHQRNTLSKRIGEAKKAGEDAAQIMEEAQQIPIALQNTEKEMKELQDEIKKLLLSIPNMLHDSVPEGESFEDDKEIKSVGKKPEYSFTPISHVDLLEKHDWADMERGSKVSGSRWYFLKGDLALLEMALTHYAVEFMTKKGYKLVIPPYAMNREAYEGVLDLGGFEEAIYKIANDDLLLIATSEHPLTAQFSGEVLLNKELPLKIVGYSACFRKEAGAHGKDQKGIFRVHQFNKIEQIIVSKPGESWKYHEELISNASEFLETLGIHHRVVILCSSETGNVAAKTADLEIWYPVQNAYREIGSESNCTDYQARRLNIKCEDSPGVNRQFAHTLNGTCIPTARALAAVLENFQQKDGTVLIPKPLQKYMGKKVIGKSI
jgi:seryl-tRNA synthetase